MRVVWELSDHFCSTLMYSVKWARVVWELSEQFCSTLMHSVKRAWELSEEICSTLMHSVKWAWVVWELSDQFFSTLMHSVKQARELFEIELPVLLNSYALGQMFKRKSCIRVEWAIFFNSHALDQTTMRVLWDLGDQVCSTLVHSVKRAWQLYESKVNRFVQLSCTRSNEHESCMRVEWPVFFNSYALGQTSTRVVWNWVTSFVQFLCTRSNERKSCMRVEWAVFFNSHALDQTTMRVVGESSDQFCSTVMHFVKRAWQLYES